MSEVKGSGRECQATIAQEQWRGATPRLRSGAAARTSYSMSEVRGSSRECQAAMAQEQQRGSTPRLRSGAATERSDPTSKARDGSREEQPHVQGVVAAQAQEGIEELFHDQGQEGRG